MAKTETFTFNALPKNVSELKALKEADLKSPFGTAALTVLALCHYEENPDETIEMLNFLKGPAPLSPYEKQFLKDRLVGKAYVPKSYFEGTSPKNSYEPSKPYTINISDDPYSYQNEGYASLVLKSSGADSPRKVTLRTKPSTGEWFLHENYLLPDIRIPENQDPWA